MPDSYGRLQFTIHEEHREEYQKALDEFLAVYQEVATIQMKRYFDSSYEKDYSVKTASFDTVMSDVISEHTPDLASGMAFLGKLLGFKAFSFAGALMDMR